VSFEATPAFALTLSKGHLYNRPALPRPGRGADRRNREEDVPAQYPEAEQDPRLPCSYGNPRWTQGSRSTSSQGSFCTERLRAACPGIGRDLMGTITSSREIDAMFRSARRAAHPLVVALVEATSEQGGPAGRVAFIAGRRVGGAVARNRAKRVLRAAAARAGAPWSGYDVILLARPGTGSASAHDLDRALKSVLGRQGVLP
jgi:ribonuclease P protein component